MLVFIDLEDLVLHAEGGRLKPLLLIFDRIGQGPNFVLEHEVSDLREPVSLVFGNHSDALRPWRHHKASIKKRDQTGG